MRYDFGVKKLDDEGFYECSDEPLGEPWGELLVELLVEPLAEIWAFGC